MVDGFCGSERIRRGSRYRLIVVSAVRDAVGMDWKYGGGIGDEDREKNTRKDDDSSVYSRNLRGGRFIPQKSELAV